MASPIESIICVEEDASTNLDEEKAKDDKKNATKKIEAPEVPLTWRTLAKKLAHTEKHLISDWQILQPA